MSLRNQDIDTHVRLLVAAFITQSGAKVRPQEERLVVAGTELVINLLQNINDIAYCAVCADQRAGQ